MAEEIASMGMSLSVIGVGSVDGAPIPVARGGFMKDRSGNIIVAKLNQDALKQLASVGGGRYRLIAPDESDINALAAQPKRTDQNQNDNPDSSQQVIEAWLDRGPWLALLLLPFVALSFRRGWM